MTRSASHAVLGLALLLPFQLKAQGRDARLDRVAPEIRDSVAALLDCARSAGLPTSPIIQKALEGTSKHASSGAIMAAVRSLTDALGVSLGLLGRDAHPDEVNAAAVALRAGARPADVSRLRTVRHARSLAVPLGVLADLIARGVPADTATRVVLALAERARDEDYIAFRRSVDRNIDLGVPPVSSALGQLNISARALTRPGGKP